MNKSSRNLKEAGYEAICLGEKLLVLPFGGRVLGVYPDEKRNVFGTNPDLESVSSIRSFFGGGGWLNIGGDRTWISLFPVSSFGTPEVFELR